MSSTPTAVWNASLSNFSSESLLLNKYSPRIPVVSLFLTHFWFDIFFANILRSISLASIWKFFAFTTFGCFRQAIPLLLCSYFERRYFFILLLLFELAVIDSLVLPAVGVSKSSSLNVSSWVSVLRLIWLLFSSGITSPFSVSFNFGSDYFNFLNFHKIAVLHKVILWYSWFNLCLVSFFLSVVALQLLKPLSQS